MRMRMRIANVTGLDCFANISTLLVVAGAFVEQSTEFIVC